MVLPFCAILAVSPSGTVAALMPAFGTAAGRGRYPPSRVSVRLTSLSLIRKLSHVRLISKICTVLVNKHSLDYSRFAICTHIDIFGRIHSVAGVKENENFPSDALPTTDFDLRPENDENR